MPPRGRRWRKSSNALGAVEMRVRQIANMARQRSPMTLEASRALRISTRSRHIRSVWTAELAQAAGGFIAQPRRRRVGCGRHRSEDADQTARKAGGPGVVYKISPADERRVDRSEKAVASVARRSRPNPPERLDRLRANAALLLCASAPSTRKRLDRAKEQHRGMPMRGGCRRDSRTRAGTPADEIPTGTSAPSTLAFELRDQRARALGESCREIAAIVRGAAHPRTSAPCRFFQ